METCRHPSTRNPGGRWGQPKGFGGGRPQKRAGDLAGGIPTMSKYSFQSSWSPQLGMPLAAAQPIEKLVPKPCLGVQTAQSLREAQQFRWGGEASHINAWISRREEAAWTPLNLVLRKMLSWVAARGPPNNVLRVCSSAVHGCNHPAPSRKRPKWRGRSALHTAEGSRLASPGYG